MIQRNFCNKKQAQALKELGVLQAGCWIYISEGLCFEKESVPAKEDIYDAWTAQELKLMIGDRFEHPRMSKPKPQKNVQGNLEAKGNLEYEVYYLTKMKSYKNEAEACADFLIALIENNVLDVEEVNERITKFYSSTLPVDKKDLES